MKNRKKFEMAIRYISEGIRTGSLLTDRYLPTIEALAAAAGVSKLTMWKAVNILKEQGILQGAPGHRIAAKQESMEEPSFQPSSRPQRNEKWYRVLEQIEKDIVNGMYVPGNPLPSVKELQVRYGAAFRTLKKALDRLLLDGLIEHTTRGYAVSPYMQGKQGTSYQKRIALIGHSTLEVPLMHGVDGIKLMHTLETECTQANIALEAYAYSPEQSPPEFHIVNNAATVPLPHDDDLLGFILLAPTTGRPVFSATNEVVRLLSHYNKPVSMYTDLEEFAVDRTLRNRSLFQIVLAAATTTPARKVAQYLLQLGHKNIAFISPFHRTRWSQKRYRGLCDAYAQAGFPDGVRKFTLNYYWADDIFDEVKMQPVYRAFEQVCSSQTNDRASDEQSGLQDSIRTHIMLQAADREIENRCAPLFATA
ncbi:MAG: GntR family transcriptional regulator, partial [Chitinivibrionales bacterium]|nr:GntR family transcriptional regulator [Chitinivibrionales bacterium]